MTNTIPAAALEILASCRVTGSTLYLPPHQLPRPLYEQVNKVLEGLGGKWSRRERGHVFPFPPSEAVEGALATGTYSRIRESFGFFPSPPAVVARLMELANVHPGMLCLEPSAGTGNIARALARVVGKHNVTCVELQGNLIDQLIALGFPNVCRANFLAPNPHLFRRYDRALMNPPFAGQADIDHVLHAWECVKPGGRLVSVMSPAFTFRTNRKSTEFAAFVEQFGTWEENPEGAFRESGTDVRTVNVVVEKPEGYA